MSQELLTAAAYPIWLGKEQFFASPLSDMAISELNNWVRGFYINNARQAAGTDEERKEITAIAIRDASTLFAFTGQGAKITATVEGMTQLVWQMLKPNHAGLTALQLQHHLLEPSNVREVNRVFTLQNITPAITGKKGGARPKTRRAVKKNRRQYHRQK